MRALKILKISILGLLTCPIATSMASVDVASAWPALRTGFDRSETLISIEIQDEIAVRVLDDQTLEYLHRIAPDRSTYKKFKQRVLERAWEPGLLQITREKAWENAGASLGLALTQREMKELLQQLLEADQKLNPQELRKLLAFELRDGASESEILTFRRQQLRKRAWTQLRSAFAIGVQKRILESKAFSSSAPREVKARYEQIREKSQKLVHWRGWVSNPIPQSDLNSHLKSLHSWISQISKQKNKITGITSWSVSRATLEGALKNREQLKPTLSATVPEELSQHAPKPSEFASDEVRLFLVASPLENGTVRAEIWIAETQELPPLSEVYREIDLALTREQHEHVLLRELRRTLTRYPTLLKITPESSSLSGDALFEKLTGVQVSKL